MQYLGRAVDSHDVSGAVNINDMVQMLSGNGRKNMVAILDISMPAPSLRGMILYSFLPFSLSVSV